jgi:hypothetical protein
MTDSRRLPLSDKVFLVCGLYLVALGLYFALLRPALLPKDPRYIGSSLEAIRVAVPGLEGWLGLVFKVMGGFMVATGALTMLGKPVVGLPSATQVRSPLWRWPARPASG